MLFPYNLQALQQNRPNIIEDPLSNSDDSEEKQSSRSFQQENLSNNPSFITKPKLPLEKAKIPPESSPNQPSPPPSQSKIPSHSSNSKIPSQNPKDSTDKEPKKILQLEDTGPQRKIELLKVNRSQDGEDFEIEAGNGQYGGILCEIGEYLEMLERMGIEEREEDERFIFE